jgi:hypothetical protein
LAEIDLQMHRQGTQNIRIFTASRFRRFLHPPRS